MSSTLLLPPPRTVEQLCNRSCSNKHTHTTTRHGWAPDPPIMMVGPGIRSPIGRAWWLGLQCTSHPGVLGSIPKREEPGKTGAPCVKVPGSSRVPLSSSPPREQLCNRSCSNKHTHQYSCDQRHTSSAGQRIRNSAASPCVPTTVFDSLRQEFSHTQNSLHGPGRFDMHHVTEVSADLSFVRKKTFMSRSRF